MCCDPRYCPPAQHQPPTPTPSRPRGGGAGGEGGGATPSARSLPPSQPSRPPTTSRINRSATPYKRCSEVHASRCSAPPTMISRVVRGCERGGPEEEGQDGGRGGDTAEHDKYKTRTNKKEGEKKLKQVHGVHEQRLVFKQPTFFQVEPQAPTCDSSLK